MMRAHLYAKFDLTQEERQRVFEGIKLMNEIIDALQKCGGTIGFEVEALTTAMGILEDIHAGRTLG